MRACKRSELSFARLLVQATLAPGRHSAGVCIVHPLRAGALQVADPARHLPDSVGTLLNPVGSVGDKMNVGWYRLKSTKGTLDTVLTNPETTTLKALEVSCPCLEALLEVA